MLTLGRSMTPHAVEPESRVRNREWRIVVVDALSIPNFCPVPTVLRALTVFDHDGPAVDSFWRLELVPSGGRGILFLHDHFSIRNYLVAIFLSETVDVRRGV